MDEKLYVHLAYKPDEGHVYQSITGGTWPAFAGIHEPADSYDHPFHTAVPGRPVTGAELLNTSKFELSGLILL